MAAASPAPPDVPGAARPAYAPRPQPPLAIVALAYTAAALAVDWPALRSAPSALFVTDGDLAARPGVAGRGGRVLRAAAGVSGKLPAG
jgi:hypothetical protein